MVSADRYQQRAQTARGFSLIETLVALTIMIAAVASASQMLALVRRANSGAEATSIASVLARQKLEQLRTLEWSFDANRIPLTDTSSDMTVAPERSDGGAGLAPSPAHSLQQNTSGYCDFLDIAGQSLGGGTAPPPRTAYVRRWSIEPLPDDPANAIVLQVRVSPWPNGGQGDLDTGRGRRLPDQARVVTARTRKAQ